MPAKPPVHRNALLNAIHTVVDHPALRTTLLVASGGISLMLANILYAKLLDPEDFGRLVLLQAIAFVAIGLLPMGFEVLIARREIAAPLAFVFRVLFIAAAVAATIVSAATFFVDDNSDILLFVFFAGVAGASTRLFSAIEQGQLKFLRSQVIAQGPSVMFLGCAIFHWFYGISSWQRGGLAWVLCFVAGGIIGLVMVRKDDVDAAPISNEGQLWFRALAMIGIFASSFLLNQLALFIAAGTLGLREVGALGLATTLIASPYKLLSHGVGFTLIPRIAAHTDKSERRKLLVQEFFIAMGVALVGAIALFLLVPPFVDLVFSDDYLIPMSLVIALIVLGLIRVNTAVFSAAINALAGTKTLHLFNLTGWISATVAAGAALALSGYGATGIVAGVSLGWILRIAFAAVLMRKEL